MPKAKRSSARCENRTAKWAVHKALRQSWGLTRRREGSPKWKIFDPAPPLPIFAETNLATDGHGFTRIRLRQAFFLIRVNPCPSVAYNVFFGFGSKPNSSSSV